VTAYPLQHMNARDGEWVLCRQQPSDSIVDMVLNDGMFAGNNPLYQVADYFERLAQLLFLN
jgi:hypothetical protein